jgi:membrane protein DedA with SNARE-associated domain
MPPRGLSHLSSARMSELFDAAQIVYLISTYGYWVIFVVVALESSGFPLPGETVLVAAAIYAGQTAKLDITSIILFAAAGAIIGDNVGYWIGRRYGTLFLQRFGPIVGIDARKLRLGQYLFMRWGGSIVFFGRFVAILRILAAVLAGVNRFDPMRFFTFNAAGGVIWALAFGLGAFFLSAGFKRVEGPAGAVAAAGALIGLIALWRYYKINERRLLAEADAALDAQTPSA